MTQPDRRARIREYKETPRPAGVYRVRNTVRKKSLVGSTTDLPGILNRHRFQLKMGSHADRELQADWKELGPDAFAFEELDRLEPKDEPGDDPRADLEVLRDMWIERLAASGESFYGRSGPQA
jgi:hypothetical protein